MRMVAALQKLTLDAAARGEIQRPSERRAALEAQQQVPHAVAGSYGHMHATHRTHHHAQLKASAPSHPASTLYYSNRGALGMAAGTRAAMTDTPAWAARRSSMVVVAAAAAAAAEGELMCDIGPSVFWLLVLAFQYLVAFAAEHCTT